MSSFSALKTAIQAAIKQNGNNEITGDILQDILLSIVSTLGDSAINDLETALGTETTNRQNADGTLQQAINSEVSAREGADNNLSGAIQSEKEARQGADSTLQTNINNEATARQNADSQLQTNINNEATARQNADTQLNNLITGIKNNIDNGYVYAGIATPSTTPVSGKVFYIATQAGTYTNLGNTAVKPGISILKYNGSTWSNEQVNYTDGGVFDVSAYNGGATYASLEALLSAANLLTIIPPAVRKGGMSIKFVSSVDNNYMQYRLTNQSWSIDVGDWQEIGSAEFSTGEKVREVGIEDEPTADSNNLVKSGGVRSALDVICKESTAREIIGDTEKLTVSSPVNTNYEEIFNGLIKAGKYYRIKLEGTNVADASPEGYAAYISVTIRSTNHPTRTILKFEKGEPFVNKEIIITSEYTGNLSFYAYVTSSVTLSVSETSKDVISTIFNNSIGSIESSHAEDLETTLSVQQGITNGVWVNYFTGYYSKLIDLTKYELSVDSCIISVASGKVGNYTFLSSEPVLNQNVSYATGYSDPIILNSGSTKVDVPQDAKYLYIREDTSGNISISGITVVFEVPQEQSAEMILIKGGKMLLPRVKVINDVTTGGTDVPLSAEQGKVLNDKFYGLATVYTVEFPAGQNTEIISENMFPAGNYTISLEGTATQHPDVTPGWSSWLNVILRNAENVVINKLVELAPGKPFTSVDIQFTMTEPFKVSTFAYYNGDLTATLKEEVSKFEYIEDEITSLEEAIAENDILSINHQDIISNRTNLISGTWENGKGIDGENLSVVTDSDYNTTDYISIDGGIYSVESNVARLSDIKLLFFDENKEAVYFEKDETVICDNGAVRTVHQRVNNYIILRQSIIDTYNIKYVRVAVRNTYSTSGVFMYKFSRASLVAEKQLAFEKQSCHGMIIKMSWFNRGVGYANLQILNDMYSLAAMGATLYLDVDNINIGNTFDTAPDGLGKCISIIAEPNIKIVAKNTLSSTSFLISYKQSEQNINASVYDEYGQILEIKPIIKGSVYECDGICGGIKATLSRGLLIEDVTVHNSPTYAIKIDTSPRSGYEYFINKCRLIYDLLVSADNTGIGGNADDSTVSDVVIIGYKTAVNIPGGANFIQNVHGWIGWNWQYQWADSRFIISNGYVTNCYADTYNYGFIMGGGSLGFSRIFTNPTFSSVTPINQLASSVKTFGNNF